MEAEGADVPPGHADWTIRMLGGLEVKSPAGVSPHFRSKSVGTLLAFLAVNAGAEVSRFLLQESIWPDSDADKQWQNLRRAISDLRAALGAPDFVETHRDVVRLESEKFEIDTVAFRSLAETGLEGNREAALARAISLYRGPLLATSVDDWVYAYRLDLEERYAQAVEALCAIRQRDGAAKEAIRIGRAALLAAPAREEIHVALIRAYRAAGLEAEALRQFEDLEGMLDETWGERPSAAASEALEGPVGPPVAARVPFSSPPVHPEPEAAGGAVPLSSRYYVARPADDLAHAAIQRKESVLLVHGPRQVGKSSLLARLLNAGRTSDWDVALSDLQTFGESQLLDAERFYKTLAFGLARQLKVEIDIKAQWNDWLGPNMNLDTIVGDLLRRREQVVCWGIDEADRIFGRGYADDFFGLLRSWHNRRALEPNGPWASLSLIISYATEAHLFIADLNQSPFNVGIRLALHDFSPSETAILASRYGLANSLSANIHHLTNGHPFLTRRACSYLSQGGTMKDLGASAILDDGPFSEHLRRILVSVSQDPVVHAEVIRVLTGLRLEHPMSRHRLTSAGLLRPDSGQQPEFRVGLYRIYLERHLGV